MMDLFFTIFLITVSPDSTKCFLCHSEIRAQYKNSVHYSEEIICSDCHGGNSFTTDMKKAHGGNFIGIPGKRKILKVCSNCHSSADKMAPYGVPFNQEALYLMSAHGKLLLKGKNIQNIPVCSDCHDYHDVRKVSDKYSPANKMNIHKTCGVCHESEEKKYKNSIHYYYLIQKGDLSSPTCIDCHGSHGAYPPGYKDIDKICGKCHQLVRKYFISGIHYKPFIETGLKECEACHGNHEVKEKSLELWDRTCTGCHSEKEEAIRVSQEIKIFLKETYESYEEANEWVKKIEKIPLEVVDLKNRLEDARIDMEANLGITHLFSVEEVKKEIEKYKGVFDDVKHEAVYKFKLFQTRYLLIPILWFMIFVTIFLIIEVRRGVKKE